MRLAIIGSGSLGSLFAAFLSPHVELVLIGHWPEQMSLLRESGLELIQLDGRQTNHVFPVSDDPSTVLAVDIALILVKCYQTVRASKEANSLLSSSGLAITLQNGLGNREILAKILGPERVTQGVTSLGAYMVAPGLVRHAGNGQVFLPTSRDHKSQNPGLIVNLARLMNNAGLNTKITANVDSLLWGKLVVNSGINPLTALLGVPNGFLVENEIARNLMIETAHETAAVAASLGINLPFSDPTSRIIEVARQTAHNHSSMLQDVRRKAPTEIDAICGEIVRHGERMGVHTPLNDEFHRLLSQYTKLDSSITDISKLASLNVLLSEWHAF